MRLNLEKKRKSKKISLTPLIDVVFLLLVFFMLSSTFLKFVVVPIEGGTASSTSTPLTRSELAVIRVFPDTKILIDDDDVTLEDVTEKLNALHDTKSLNNAVVKAEKGVKVQEILTILQSAKRSKLKNVMLVR